MQLNTINGIVFHLKQKKASNVNYPIIDWDPVTACLEAMFPQLAAPGGLFDIARVGGVVPDTPYHLQAYKLVNDDVLVTLSLSHASCAYWDVLVAPQAPPDFMVDALIELLQRRDVPGVLGTHSFVSKQWLKSI